jgi:hypothetical protein
MVKENSERDKIANAIINNGQDIVRLKKLQRELAECRMYYRTRVLQTEKLQQQIDADWAYNNELIDRYADNEESLVR